MSILQAPVELHSHRPLTRLIVGSLIGLHELWLRRLAKLAKRNQRCHNLASLAMNACTGTNDFDSNRCYSKLSVQLPYRLLW